MWFDRPVSDPVSHELSWSISSEEGCQDFAGFADFADWHHIPCSEAEAPIFYCA